jgi:hypothetical protein
MGGTEGGFGELARAAGVALVEGAVRGLTVRGHLARAAGAADGDAVEALVAIYAELGGDKVRLAAKRERALRPDFLLNGLQVVEVDEVQHFTSERACALELYPPSVPLGFDVEEYVTYCRCWAATADRYRAEKRASDFPFPGGRRAQRAYLDAVRDLLAPALTGRSVIRAAAPECDAGCAFDRVRHALLRRSA